MNVGIGCNLQWHCKMEKNINKMWISFGKLGDGRVVRNYIGILFTALERFPSGGAPK